MPLLSGDMTIRFIARVVGVEEGADDCLSAGIAEAEGGDGVIFDFQCAMYEPAEQDIAWAGQPTVRSPRIRASGLATSGIPSKVEYEPALNAFRN